MERKIVITDDGSSSIFVPELGEHYHSHFGARQESQHIFIESALAQIQKNEISILEFGFGTGLNALLSHEYALKNDIRINYTAIEKYPLQEKEYLSLNYPKKLGLRFFQSLHQLPWEQWMDVAVGFKLLKNNIDIREFKISKAKFDVVYFDAFAPDVQPNLWSYEVFMTIYNSMNKGGILTTYTVKGSIRRMLKEIGFEVEKIPGPPGKREITRAKKLS